MLARTRGSAGVFIVFRISVALALAGAALGCDGDVIGDALDAGPGDQTAAADPGPGAPDQTDAATPDAAAPDAAAGDTAGELPGRPDAAASLRPAGGVLVFEARSEFLNRANASAGFTEYRETEPVGTPYGPCVVVFADPDAPKDPPQSLDAGPIAITGTTPAVMLGYFDPLAAGGKGYQSSLAETNETLLPAEGAPVTAEARGGADLPAFSITVATPTPMTVTAPAGGLFSSIAAGVALDVAWTPGNGETTLVSVNVLNGQFKAVAGNTILCTLTGDPGALTVPAEAMQTLPSGIGYRALVGVTRIRTAKVPLLAGEVTLGVTASSGVVPTLR